MISVFGQRPSVAHLYGIGIFNQRRLKYQRATVPGHYRCQRVAIDRIANLLAVGCVFGTRLAFFTILNSVNLHL